jgi:pyrroline-5-carboxylate reductase
MSVSIGFVGGGNMASAMIGGLIGKGFDPGEIHVIEVSDEARVRLQREFGIEARPTFDRAFAGSECIVLATKPQQLREVAQTLASSLHHQLLISIAAGIRTEDLMRWLGGYRRVVRVMPNTPALVGLGMSALFATTAVNASERNLAESILSAVGETFWLADEGEMDGVTAISGSGPAYVFYFIEALEEAARKQGFDTAAARQLTVQTVLGAARLAADSSDDARTLRARVTSKGGTTESAIEVFETARLKEIVARAVARAAERSRALGEELGSSPSRP